LSTNNKLQAAFEQVRTSILRLRAILLGPILCGLIIGCAWAVSVHAQISSSPAGEYPIDLSTALRLAGTQNLQIAAAEAKMRRASGDLWSAYERFLPSLDAEWAFARHEDLTQSTEGEFLDVDKQSHRTAGVLSATWDLNEALFALLATQRAHDAATYKVESTTDAALLEVAEAYFDLVQAAAETRLAVRALGFSEDLAAQSARSVAEGVGNKVDVLRAQTQQSHDHLILHQRQEDVQVASARLARLLNLTQPTTLTPVDTVVAVMVLIDTTDGLNALLAASQTTHPQLLASQESQRAALWSSRQAVWGPLFPTIKAQALFGSYGSTLADLSPTRDYALSVRWTLGPSGLFDFGRIRRQRAQARLAEIHLEEATQQVSEAIARSHAQLRQRSQMIAIADVGRQAAREALALAIGRRDLGVARAFEVIDAAEALDRAEREHAGAIIDYNRSQVEALAARGRLRTPE
jgi:outer membrane protein TolC